MDNNTSIQYNLSRRTAEDYGTLFLSAHKKNRPRDWQGRLWLTSGILPGTFTT